MWPDSETPISNHIWVSTNSCVSIEPRLFRVNLTTGPTVITSHLFEFDDDNHFQSRPKPSIPHGVIYPLRRPTQKHSICSKKFWAWSSNSKSWVNNFGVMVDWTWISWNDTSLKSTFSTSSWSNFSLWPVAKISRNHHTSSFLANF